MTLGIWLTYGLPSLVLILIPGTTVLLVPSCAIGGDWRVAALMDPREAAAVVLRAT